MREVVAEVGEERRGVEDGEGRRDDEPGEQRAAERQRRHRSSSDRRPAPRRIGRAIATAGSAPPPSSDDRRRVVLGRSRQSAEQPGDGEPPVQRSSLSRHCRVVCRHQARETHRQQQRHQDVGHREMRVANVQGRHREEPGGQQPGPVPGDAAREAEHRDRRERAGQRHHDPRRDQPRPRAAAARSRSDCERWRRCRGPRQRDRR